MYSDRAKILIAFFSRAGENYSKGKTVVLEKGNTAAAAELIAGLTGGELYEIKTVKQYPFAYRQCAAEAVRELMTKERPTLAYMGDTDGYDTVILGYPNWCGTMPRAVCSFLDGHNMTGKTILPFCTNEGSGLGRSMKELTKLCPNSRICPGLSINGSSVPGSEPEIKKWLGENL